MYSSTQKFINLMDEKGIKYEYCGILNETTQSETVSIRYTGKNLKTIEVNFTFNKNCRDVAIAVYNIAVVPDNKLGSTIIALNALNCKWRFVRFCLDRSDNTVQVESDAVFRDTDVDEICVELLTRVVSITDEAYTDIMKAIYA